jgi:lysozyme
MLQFVADNFAKDVSKSIKSIISQNQLNALTAFAYNVGFGDVQKKIPGFVTSTLLKKVNANPNDPTIKEEFLKWNKSNGKILQGLINRRRAESNLYFQI